MDGLKAALTFSVKKLSKSVGVYTAVVGIFFYHVVLDKDLQCTCEDQTRVCWSYMILPAFIIFFMVLWLDGSFQALLKYTCLKRTRFSCFLLAWIIRAVLISLLWPMSVLINGDWYACCWHEEKLYCNLTADGQRTMKELKNDSRIYGFGVLLGIIAVAAILRCVPWMECCTHQGLKECCTWCLKKCCTDESNEPTANSESKCLSKDELFKNIVLEVGESLVKNKLIEVAKGKIDQKIDAYVGKKQWGKCYDVVKEIIEELSQHDDSTDPTNTVPTSTVPTSTVPTNTVPTNPNPPNTNSTNTDLTNPNPSPGGSPSAEGGRNGDEIELMVQRPSRGLPSESSSNDDVGENELLIPLSPSAEGGRNGDEM